MMVFRFLVCSTVFCLLYQFLFSTILNGFASIFLLSYFYSSSVSSTTILKNKSQGSPSPLAIHPPIESAFVADITDSAHAVLVYPALREDSTPEVQAALLSRLLGTSSEQESPAAVLVATLNRMATSPSQSAPSIFSRNGGVRRLVAEPSTDAIGGDKFCIDSLASTRKRWARPVRRAETNRACYELQLHIYLTETNPMRACEIRIRHK